MANGNGRNAKRRRGFIKYRSYLFVDKDPIIDQIRTARSDTRKTFRQVHEKSGVSVATIRNWEHGKTRRPQFATVMAVINALGKSLVTKNGKPFIV